MAHLACMNEISCKIFDIVSLLSSEIPPILFPAFRQFEFLQLYFFLLAHPFVSFLVVLTVDYTTILYTYLCMYMQKITFMHIMYTMFTLYVLRSINS